MKKTFSVLSFLVLMITASFSQKSEEGQFFDVPIATYPIEGWVSRIDTVPAWWASDVFRPSEFVQAAPALGCSDRDRRIRKMLIDIECDDIQPEELGFDCDTLCQVGVHASFVVYYQNPNPWGNGEFLTLVRPASDVTPQGWRRGDQARQTSQWFPISTPCRYSVGDTMRLR